MTFKTHCKIAKGRIDPAPMVDIVFLLLIFLVLSSPFVLQPGFGTVDLPQTPISPNVSFQTLVVTITREEPVFLQHQPTTLDNLRQSLERVAQQTRDATLIIKADRQVMHGTVARLRAWRVGNIDRMNAGFNARLSILTTVPCITCPVGFDNQRRVARLLCDALE